MEEFFDNIRLLTNTLGCKIFEPIISQNNGEQNILKIHTKGIIAKGTVTNDGFVVLKGSQFARDFVPSYGELNLAKRDELITSGVLVDVDGVIIAKRDIIFPSPSAAAVQVMGRNANGLIEWKTTDGRALKSL